MADGLQRLILLLLSQYEALNRTLTKIAAVINRDHPEESEYLDTLCSSISQANSVIGALKDAAKDFYTTAPN